MPDMFWFQCQQTAGNKGCVVMDYLQQTVSCRQERVIKIACIQHQLLDMKD